MCKTNIVWQDVQGYEGRYKVSNYGDIMSLLGGRRCTAGNGLMKPQNMNGSWSIMLCKDGVRTTHTVSHLVAQAFLYPTLDTRDFSIVRHLDGDFSNCCVDNLVVYFQPTAAGRVANIA